MAGLLDYIFDPSSYTGNGGLLSRLTPSLAQIPQSQGFPQSEQPQQAQPMSVGDYQMPRMGGSDLYQPQQVMTPPNAQPTQGQMAQAQQEQFNPLSAGFEGFARNLHTGPIGAVVGGVGSALGLGRNNQTAQFLVSKGIEPALAKTIVSDPGLLRSVLPQLIGGGGQTDDIKEYQFAKREDPSLTFQKFMQQKKAVSGEYGMQPIWGVDAQGRPAVLQLGKSGEAKQSVLPDGFSLSRDPIKVEGPTGTTILDPQTRQPVQFIPKDVAEAAKQKEIGEARGQATVSLPTTIANAEQTLQVIKSLKDDPYRTQATGLSSVFNAIPATGGFDYAQKLEQLKGRTFLEAFQALKGGGAITEIEGKKAEAAIARLNPGQSEKSFLEALNELEQIVSAGIERAKQRAGQPGAPQQAAAPKRIRLNADGSIAQ
jgi:hypothetical protein